MNFSITINAPKEKVWQTLWDDESYRAWAAEFAEGSRAVTDWSKGSKVLFLGNDDKGMVSQIAENIPNEFMSFRHLGIYGDGREDTESQEAQKWKGFENYRLSGTNGKTDLTVALSMDNMPPEFVDYFQQTWPKALQKLKQLAEGQ